MLKHITHEEYVTSMRKRKANIAKSMLEGRLTFLEGSRILTSLRHEADVQHDDPDFITFVVIDSETDELPIGDVRQYWSNEALDKLDDGLKKAEIYAQKSGTESCISLIRRFDV